MKTSRFIARVLGLSGILIVLTVLLSGGTALDRIYALMSDPGFQVQAGFTNLLIGLSIVIGHNVWDRSWRVVITVFGYLALSKGIVLLAWPDAFVAMSERVLDSGLRPIQMIVGAAFCGWIAWLGFRPENKSQEDPPTTAKKEPAEGGDGTE